MQVGGTQSKFPLFAVLGVVDGVVFGVVDGVVDEVPRRAVFEVVTHLASAAHVAWTHASGSFDSATANFAIMSG